jgi:hypothetical protein
MALPQ